MPYTRSRAHMPGGKVHCGGLVKWSGVAILSIATPLKSTILFEVATLLQEDW